jgi:hypothetical protein
MFDTEGRIDRRTDRHEEANNRFSQLCDSAYKYVPLSIKINVANIRNGY